MRLFPAPMDDPNFDADIFERREFGNRLTRLILALEHPAVLLLDAPWGAGKTTFIKMWEKDLRDRKIPTIHFDAFASDYMADPFTALAGEVLELAKQHQNDDAKVDEFRQKALGVVKVLARHGLRIGVKVATQGLVDIGSGDDAKADEKAVVDGATDAADALLLKRLENHTVERDTFAAFRGALKDLATALGPTELPEGERHPPLVFIIDELDRCRPTFALSLLETVKHFFDVDSVVFVLSTNMAQLEKSVEFAYGTGIDARGYLDKFFHLRAVLPAAQNRKTPTSTYIAHLFEKIPPKFFQRNRDELMRFAISLANERSFSLRKLERIFTYLNIFTISWSGTHITVRPDIVIALCFIKAGDPQQYDIIRSYPGETEAFAQWGFPRSSRTPSKISKEAFDAYFLNRQMVDSARSEIEHALASDNLNRTDYIPLWCSWIDGFALPDDLA